MANSGSSDVVVVGGGVVGVSIALELARRGREVVLIERSAGVASGSSAGNAGYVVPSHATPLASPRALRNGLRWIQDPAAPLSIRFRPGILPWLAQYVRACTPERTARGTEILRALALRSLELHQELVAEGIATSFERSGILNVYETGRGFAIGRAEAQAHQAAGLKAEVLDAQQTVELEPALVGALAGSVLYPDEGVCDPRRFCVAVADAAIERGAVVKTKTEVLSLSTADDRLVQVQTTGGQINARNVILAAGIWTERLARDVGIGIPLQGGKGYHVEFEREESQPRLPVFLQEAHVTTTSFDYAFRLTGGLDLCGYDEHVDPRRTQAIVAAAQRLLAPTATATGPISTWRGLRPCSPDGLPLIGRTPDRSNLILCTGHAMLGVSLAPVSAQLVADLLAGRRSSVHDVLDPHRFAYTRRLARRIRRHTVVD